MAAPQLRILVNYRGLILLGVLVRRSAGAMELRMKGLAPELGARVTVWRPGAVLAGVLPQTADAWRVAAVRSDGEMWRVRLVISLRGTFGESAHDEISHTASLPGFEPLDDGFRMQRRRLDRQHKRRIQ